MTGTPRRTNALWFFVAFVGGGASVWWTKSVTPNAWFAAIVAAGVVLALMTYYILNDEDAPEEEGDNVYYLGLLFTLVSLMFTLVELFGADTTTVRSAENIRALLENFGIALTSTVVGIAGRVAVQNWQRTGSAETPEFVEDTALPARPPVRASAEDLEKFNRYLLGRIARDLTQGANALARFHRIVRSHASDTEDFLHNQSETLKRESIAYQETLQRNSEAFAKELKGVAESTLGAVGDALNAVVKQSEALPERLRSAHDAYLTEIREATRVFHDEIRSTSGESLDSIRRNFDAAAQQSISLTQNVTTAHERIGKALDSFETGLGQAGDSSAALGSSTHQAAKSTAALEMEIDKLRAVVAAVRTDAVAITVSMLDTLRELDTRIRAGRDIEQTAATVQQIGETLKTITAEAASAAERTAEAAELFDALTKRLRTTEGESQRAEEALRILANEAEARVDSLRQRRDSSWSFWNRGR